MTDLFAPLEVPRAIPISDFVCVRDTFVSLDVVTGHPNGKRKQVEMFGGLLVTSSYGERSLEMGDALAV
jgi:hypothetical protein